MTSKIAVITCANSCNPKNPKQEAGYQCDENYTTTCRNCPNTTNADPWPKLSAVKVYGEIGKDQTDKEVQRNNRTVVCIWLSSSAALSN